MAVAACMAFHALKSARLEEWLSAHRRQGVSHFILSTEDSHTLALSKALAPWIERGEVAMLQQREPPHWKFNESSTLQLIGQPIIRRWMGQLEFLHRCVDEALRRRPRVAWLFNLDVDEFAFSDDPVVPLPEALNLFHDEPCLLLRRHNFVDTASEGPILSTSLRRATFPPLVPPKGEMRRRGLRQPLHPKWVLNIRYLWSVSFSSSHLALNQHVVLNSSRCEACARAALQPVRGAAPSRDREPLRNMTAAGMKLELSALAPFSLSATSGTGQQEFSEYNEFNDMTALDGNQSNPCQFPRKCSLASSAHAGAFSSMPPPKQRLLSCFSPTAAALLLKSRRGAAPSEWAPPAERCWQPVCLSGERAEAALRVHHYGLHGFDTAAAGETIEDRHALSFFT